MKTTCILLILLGIQGCFSDKQAYQEKWKAEIIEAEAAFVEMAKREGISEAFLHFAAEDATILRNDTLYIGKEQIRLSLDKQPNGEVELTWAPDFVDVSAAGDLGYTYGNYTFAVTDSLGNKTVSKGIFHTVWKRQPDGTWKFVWD